MGKRGRDRLIVYAKKPAAGLSKTRLGATIGNEGATGFYSRCLIQYLTSVIQAKPSYDIELSIASADDMAFFIGGFPELAVVSQVQGGLGDRMWASLYNAFSAGYKRVVLTGSDIPGLTTEVIAQAFRALEHASVAIGPASDGGYYLVAMRAPGWDIFERVDWSTDLVLAQTLERLKAHDVDHQLLEELGDVDTVSDYEAWREARIRARHV